MASVNKVILVGALGQDPETKSFSNGGSVTQFSIATTEQWVDKNTGERKELTEWHRIVLNNRLGEVAQQYLRKGSKVYIEGSLRTRKWTDQSGQERYVTEIRGDNMQMLDSGRGNNPSQNDYPAYGGRQNDTPSNYSAPQQARPEPARNNPPAAPSYGGHNELDDDLPF